MKTKNLDCILKDKGFNDFLSLLEDLSKIDDLIKIKISSDKIFMYSMKGEGNAILAFKNYYVDTDDFIQNLDTTENIDIIIPNSKKFVKNLKFIDIKSSINLSLKVKPLNEGGLEVRALELKNKKLKLKWMTAEQYEMKNIEYPTLMGLLDIKNQRLSFDVSRSDFDDIKKLANINGSTLIEISSDNGKILMSETSSWEIEVDEIMDNTNIMYNVNKNLLGFINDGSDSIKFHVFNNFILIRDDNSNVMVSFEQSY